MPRRLPLVAVLVGVPAAAFAATLSIMALTGSEPASTVSGATSTTPSSVAVELVEDPPVTAGEPPASTTPPSTARATTKSPPRSPSVTSPPGAPEPAADPRGLADQIVRAEAVIADPSAPADELSRMAHLEQVVFRRLVAQPEWRAEVLAALPPGLRPVVTANVTAGEKLRAMITKPRETLPAWRIVPPAPAEELLGYYKEASADTGVGWEYLAAIHLVETRMGRIRGTSTAGAQGPMQFMPATWAAYGEGDINSNRDSIAAAARYLKRNGAPGKMRQALWNYNHDYRYVDAVTLYAQRMASDPRAYHGYHQWQVYYITVNGDVWLPEGFDGTG
jgi:hypothetical protein